MNTKIVKFANPNDGFSAEQMLQAGRKFIVRLPEKPYDVNKDIAKFLKKDYPDEFIKQVNLGNIPNIKTKNKI